MMDGLSDRPDFSLPETGPPAPGSESADTDLPLEDRTEGGLGVHIVRNLMDEINYQRAIGRNTVTLVKLLGEPAA